MSAFIRYADTCSESRLPIPVRFFLDDYGATTNIYNLDSIISTIRSRNISVSLILQAESQLMKRGQKPVYAEISDRPVLQEKHQIRSLSDTFGGNMSLF